jgi:hypothetical protein
MTFKNVFERLVERSRSAAGVVLADGVSSLIA